MFIAFLIIVSTMGLLFSILAKAKSMESKANKANISFSMSDFVKRDKLTILTTYVVIALALMIFAPILRPDVLITKDRPVTFFFELFTVSVVDIYKIFINIVFATLGYSGMDIALRFFSRTNKMINDKIDEKTTIADSVTGTNTPTSL
jgi:hypothetical protein